MVESKPAKTFGRVLSACELGLHPRHQGQVDIQGQRLESISAKKLAKKISYVPQYHRLAFGYAVVDIVLMGVMAGLTYLTNLFFAIYFLTTSLEASLQSVCF